MARDYKENQVLRVLVSSVMKMIIGEMFLFKHLCVLVAVVLLIKAGLVSGDDGKVRCIERERRALLEFKEGVIDDYGILSSWESAEEEKKDCCKWRGVRCNNITAHVIRLDLHSSYDMDYHHLRGKISPSLLELQHLKYLDLSYNYFSETHIPNFIASFPRLQHLNLAETGFVGTIPNQFGNLSKLRYLDLGSNYFVSVKSLEWLSHLSLLRYLDLNWVDLSNAMDWMEATNKLPLLTELHLNECGLEGIIISPSLPLINSSGSLAVIDLSDNSLNSSIYTWLFNFNTSLAHVELSRNNLQGLIPDAFGNFNSLAYLNLESNQLEGGIPKSFGNLSSLRTLDLSGNELTGQISMFLQNLSGGADKSLEILGATENQIGGSLPDTITRLSSLEELYLFGNQFNGSLPDFIGLSQLRVLYLSHNQLSGSLPNFIGLSSLRELNLSNNQLSGPLPNFTRLSLLRKLDLSNNQLSGSLPKTLGQLFMLEILCVSSNSLEGTISEAHLSNLNNLKQLDLSFNSLALEFSSDWNPSFQLDFLYLRSCRLGPQFPNSLLTQKNYSELDISNSGISDIVPREFWNLSPRLSYLNLSYNQINGMVPDLSLKTVFYAVIDLSSNRFEGPIAPFPPNVIALHLSKNMFSGSISFICNVTNEFLSSIDLSDNRLSGELPDCWMHTQNLVILNLANNNFSGKIPQSIGFLYELQTLHLRNNNFIGDLPSSLKNGKELKILDLGENILSGKIPTWIGTNLTSLIVLSLRLNKFHGHIPRDICHLNYIQILDLSQNNIYGIIPQCFNNFTTLVWGNKSNAEITYSFLGYDGVSYVYSEKNQYEDHAIVQWKGREVEFKNILALLRSIDLSSNRLVGKIPEEFSSLAGLGSLNLSGNCLSGHVIQKIGELKNLESLDLSRNQLSGEIPSDITRLTFLAVLDLSNNKLSGKIPSSTQLQSFDASAYAGNHDLCGLPLPNKCPGDETDVDPSVTNIIQKDEDGFINREFYVSMGLGFGIAFGGVVGTLQLKRSWEYVFFNFLNNIKDWVYVTTAVNMARLRRQLQS